MNDFMEWLLAVVPFMLVMIAVFGLYVVYNAAKAFQKANPATPGFGLDDLAWMAVTGVEQMFFDKEGEFKFDKAFEFVKRYAVNADDTMIQFAIESAVKLMNSARQP